MISEDRLIQKRFSELANKAYTGNHFTFTDFLGLSEIDLFYRCERELNHVKYEMFGGTEGCSRLMVRFGDAEELGYSESYPIDCVKIAPLLMKFSDNLTHRDILGAIMGLGIKRSAVGDIILKNNVAYMFVVDRLSQYVCDNLFKVKHTSVSCEITQEIPDFYESSLTEITVLVPSLRIDAVIAKLYNLSRNSSIELFREKKIFVNGRSCENNSYFLKENDIITVRGRGRFTFIKENFTTRKGNVNISVAKTQ